VDAFTTKAIRPAVTGLRADALLTPARSMISSRWLQTALSSKRCSQSSVL